MIPRAWSPEVEDEGASARCDVGDVIITGELDRRSSRAPDHEAEARALTMLAEAMSTHPGTVLQRLVELAMELTRSDSAGISLLEPGGENSIFRWVATAGAWSPYRDGTMPRDASPCGEVIAREAVLLMKNPERSFPALLQAEPGISEGLLAPFHLGGVPVGTVWTIKHGLDGRFEAEDARILRNLARFAAAAHQTMQALRSAEAASQQAEARVRQLATLADVSSEFFGICDMDFMPTYGNAAAMRMVGLIDLQQVKRTPLQDFFFPEDLPFITDEFLPRVLREGQAKVEIRFRHFVTGEPVWVDYSLVVLRDESGRATGLGTVTHDLTERRRAEWALRESEARFRALATVGSSSIYRMSPDWREMRHLDGASFLADAEEATTDWVETYIPAGERPRVREAIDRAISARDVFELEHRVLRADGTVGWTFSRAIPLLDDAGRISGWFGAATDVTPRVKADQSFMRLFQAAPAPFLILKPDAPHFTIAEVNDAYLSATMRTRDEVVGRGIFEAYPINPSDEASGGVNALRASLERVVASGRPDTLPNLQYDVARPDGAFEKRWWSPVNSAVLDDSGKVEALIHNANDVTEARIAELALRESEGRHAFLLKLSDALRPLRDPLEAQTATMRLVVEHLHVTRAGYFKIDADEDGLSLTASYDRGPLPMPDRMRVSDFAPDMVDAYRQGRTLLIEDTEMEAPTDLERAAYRAIGVRAGVGVPLVKNGRLLGIFGVHSATPRHWSGEEVRLLEDIADRIWTAVDRAHAEAALRDSEARQAFLLKLSDALRTVADPIEVQAMAARLLGEHIGADRCGYVEMDDTATFLTCHRDYHAVGVASFAGTYPIAGFGEVITGPLFAGKTVVLDDATVHAALSDPAVAEAYERVDVLGSVAAPLVKNGRLAAILFVHQREPRRWSPAEVAMIEDVAQRTWATVERALSEEALRESRARLAAAFESVPLGAAVIDMSGSTMLANAEFRRFLPTNVIPSRDPVRGQRWRGWDAKGRPLDPTEFPGARAMRGEHVVPGQEMLYTDDDGREIWTSVATAPIRVGDGQVTGQVCVISDIDVLKRSIEALRESEARFREFSDASTNILWIRNAATMRMEFASPAFDAIYGIAGPERRGDPGLRAWARLIEPKSRRNVLANFKRVREGERIEVEFQFRRPSDGALRWVHNTDFPLRDAAGDVRWIAGLGADVTDAKEAADRQGVLVAELQHRTRNLIAVVRSLSDRTLGNAVSLEDFGRRFRLRLSALSRVQGLLSHLAAGERVMFDELLRTELAAHGVIVGVADNVTLDGPAGVALRSGTVQTLALGLHELATNAVKYGALTAPDGHLSVRWRIQSATGAGPPLLHVEWRESGVVMPKATAPSGRGGYGRELIERALPYQLKAKTSYELGADGVLCTIAVPISRTAGEGGSGDE